MKNVCFSKIGHLARSNHKENPCKILKNAGTNCSKVIYNVRVFTK